MINDYDPKSLPHVDAVDVVDIRRLVTDRVSHYMQIAGDESSVRFFGESAQPFADAWRSLVPGESARCHVPPIGLRFISNEKICLEASVCWRCNNLFGLSGGVEYSYSFDSDSTAARKLFALSQESIGIEVIGDG
jgi:hypothetical protein